MNILFIFTINQLKFVRKMSVVFSFRTCSNVNIKLCSKDKKVNATNGDEHITMQIVWDVRKAI